LAADRRACGYWEIILNLLTIPGVLRHRLAILAWPSAHSHWRAAANIRGLTDE
jgi:hypothetical protein